MKWKDEGWITSLCTLVAISLGNVVCSLGKAPRCHLAQRVLWSCAARILQEQQCQNVHCCFLREGKPQPLQWPCYVAGRDRTAPCQACKPNMEGAVTNPSPLPSSCPVLPSPHPPPPSPCHPTAPKLTPLIWVTLTEVGGLAAVLGWRLSVEVQLLAVLQMYFMEHMRHF